MTDETTSGDIMSRTPKLLVLSVAVLSSACAVDTSTGPAPAVSVLASHSTSSDKAKPAGGTCTTSFTQISFVFPIATIDITGVCNLKHLGRTTLHAIQTINVLTGDLNNSTTYTAANGDMLFTTFVGTSSPPPDVVFQGTETYVGGTGRFEGATGSSTLEGTATVDVTGAGTGEYTSTGSITY
jgi:hypothetical protein